MLKRRDYPKELLIGDEVYRVRFVRSFKDKKTVGECDPSDKEIRILCGQSRDETLKCFIHELIHALVEFENDIKIKHKLIYRLEKPILQFIKDNVLKKRV